MKTISRIILILFALIMALSIFAGCSSEDTQSTVDFTSSSSSVSTSSSSSAVAIISDVTAIETSYTEIDINGNYTQDTATIITLDNEKSTVIGDGASYSNGVVNITRAGTYILSGSLSGQVVVEATSVDEVQIVLNGVEIINNTGAAIFIKQAEKATITLAENSTNYVEDGTSYSDTSDDAPDAAIYADDDLTINGTGALTVIGNYKHGIKCADNLIITNGNLNVTAANDGIRGKDSVSILDGYITVSAGGDGITATNADDSDRGWITIDGGVFYITAYNNGFQAESALNVNAGEINIAAGQDTYHCNNDILITGATSILNSGDDGMHADNILNIAAGDVIVTSNYEGIEGASVIINGGNISIEAVDDGINAAGGSDSDIASGDRFSSESGNNVISITDGYIYVSIIGDEGDGLDSNGDIYLSGGTIVIDGGVSQRDAAIDINMGTFQYSGGTLASVGSTAMLAIPDTVSQPVITILFDDSQTPEDEIAVLDDSGNTILSFTPKKTYPVAMFSSPELEIGETYTVTMDGDELFTITLDSTTVTVDGEGNATEYQGTSGPGGDRQNGQMPPQGGRGN